MARQQAENSNALNIFWLKKQGYFPQGLGIRSGTVSWTHGWSGNKSSIGIFVVVGRESENYIRLEYTHTDRYTEEKSRMDYKVNLLTTPCRFGGARYWFECPLIKNGKYCGRRVGVLYLCGKYYGCRHCCNIGYQAQLEGGKWRTGSVCEPDVEKAWNEIKRQYYAGKPTRRYKRYMHLREKMDYVWIIAAKKFGINF